MVGQLPTEYAHRTPQDRLIWLHAGLSPISDACSVAAFISSLFSNLTKIENWRGQWGSRAEKEQCNRWMEVELLLREWNGN
jgi:hypothetical protein